MRLVGGSRCSGYLYGEPPVIFPARPFPGPNEEPSTDPEYQRWIGRPVVAPGTVPRRGTIAEVWTPRVPPGAHEPFWRLLIQWADGGWGSVADTDASLLGTPGWSPGWATVSTPLEVPSDPERLVSWITDRALVQLPGEDPLAVKAQVRAVIEELRAGVDRSDRTGYVQGDTEAPMKTIPTHTGVDATPGSTKRRIPLVWEPGWKRYMTPADAKAAAQGATREWPVYTDIREIPPLAVDAVDDAKLVLPPGIRKTDTPALCAFVKGAIAGSCQRTGHFQVAGAVGVYCLQHAQMVNPYPLRVPLPTFRQGDRNLDYRSSDNAGEELEAVASDFMERTGVKIQSGRLLVPTPEAAEELVSILEDTYHATEGIETVTAAVRAGMNKLKTTLKARLFKGPAPMGSHVPHTGRVPTGAPNPVLPKYGPPKGETVPPMDAKRWARWATEVLDVLDDGGKVPQEVQDAADGPMTAESWPILWWWAYTTLGHAY